MILPAFETDKLQCLHGTAGALFFIYTLYFKSVFGIRQHGTVRKQAELLEYHPDIFTPERPQLL
ncbi:hypothetical protein D3C72_2430680 [compost metagenome]